MTSPNPTLKAKDVRGNAFTDNLGHDFIAVNAEGVPIARSADKESLERAAPNHSGIFTGKDFPKDGPSATNSPDEVPMVTPTGEAAIGDNIDPTAVATQREAEPIDNATPAAARELEDNGQAEKNRRHERTDPSSRQRKPVGDDKK